MWPSRREVLVIYSDVIYIYIYIYICICICIIYVFIYIYTYIDAKTASTYLWLKHPQKKELIPVHSQHWLPWIISPHPLLPLHQRFFAHCLWSEHKLRCSVKDFAPLTIWAMVKLEDAATCVCWSAVTNCLSWFLGYRYGKVIVDVFAAKF